MRKTINLGATVALSSIVAVLGIRAGMELGLGFFGLMLGCGALMSIIELSGNSWDELMRRDDEQQH